MPNRLFKSPGFTIPKVEILIKRVLLIALLGVMGFVYLGSSFIVLLVLFFIGSISMIYKRKIKGFPVGIEFVVMTTVIASKAYVPIVGLIFGAITSVTAQAVSGEYDAGMFLFFISTMLIGFISHYLPFSGLTILAIMVLFSDAFTQSVAFIESTEQRMTAGAFVVTHLFISIIFWNVFGEILFNFAALAP